MGSVLMTGDLHGNTGHALALLRVAARQECDRLFVLGDFGAWEHIAAGRRYFDVVNRAARKCRVQVYFLDGNHDKSSLLHRMYGAEPDDEGFLVCRKNIRYAPRGLRWTWEGTRFAAFGGAYSVDKQWRLAHEASQERTARRRRQFGSARHPVTAETLWFPEEEMTDDECDALLADDSPVDVLLTHDKPRGSDPDWNRKNLPECLPNQDRIQRVVRTLRPDLLLHGHLHYRYTDSVDRGDGATTRVEGLGADPEGSALPDYRSADSWLVLPLPYAAETAAHDLAV
ncbi:MULTISPECIES: metallophosphoesterase family protein [Nocardia]|uniref:metallophosphoesterase family protein n=1 Tax=Nocardia TaxID=1817 RepID=UPI000D69526D|nr:MULTISPECIES: metallophosphoesterase [Nocardia]